MSSSSKEVLEKFKNKSNNEKVNIEDLFKTINDCDINIDNNDINKDIGRLNAPIMILHNKKINSRVVNKFSNFLSDYKLSSNDLYHTTLYKCECNNDECELKCFDYLLDEINILNPKIIIAYDEIFLNLFDINFNEIKKIKESLLYVVNLDNQEQDNKLSLLEDEFKKIKNKMFVQLHFHDEYSIRDAIGKIEDYKDIVLNKHLSAFSVTNHGNISGFIRQYNFCKKINIKPIFGCEIYINDHRSAENKKELGSIARKNYHLCVYSSNIEGFNNLSRITTDAWINGFYYKPRTDHDYLKDNSKGLFASSACMGGTISKFLIENNIEQAKHYVELYKSIFEEFRIELMLINLKDQVEINKKLIKLAIDTNTKCIITVDTHYRDKDWNEVHNNLLLLRDNFTKSDFNDPSKSDKIFQYEADDLFYKDVDDIYYTFEKYHKNDIFTEDFFWESIDNTYEFIDMIENIKLDETLKLPVLSDNSDQLLWDLIEKALKDKKLDDKQEYIDRVNREYEVITNKKFTDYFLIMYDIIKYAKEHSLVGAGRGSSSGSLIAYLLRITEIDPIEYGLLFERFLDPSREDIVDIDSDFEPKFRDNIKEYIIERFGDKHVCSIGSYGTYKTRGVLLDISRIYDIPYQESSHITKNILTSDVDNMSFKEIRSEFPQVDEYFKKYPEIELSCNVLKGQVKNMSKHAAGMIISNIDLTKNIPLMTAGGHIFSAWQEGSDYHELSSLGYVKFDILGLNNLSVISDCIKIINTRHNKLYDFYNFKDMDDKKSFEMASNGDTFGIFQFESRISKQLLKNIGIDCFKDLSHISSILRPGPLRAGIHEVFERRKKGLEEYEIPEILNDILKDTHGLIIYQEQIMKIAMKIGDFNSYETNRFRKALVKYGKGDDVETLRLGEVFSYKDKFVKNASKFLGEEEAKDMFEKIASFSAYGFNLSHSISYAYISYIQLYFKSHYFIEFSNALLNNVTRGKETNQKEKYINLYISNILEKGINILNPDINKSKSLFSILDDKTIIFGIEHIKNLNQKDFDVINECRPYSSFIDFCDKMGYNNLNNNNFFIKKKINIDKKLNKSKIESLIYAGCFDYLIEDKNEDKLINNRNELINYFNNSVNKNNSFTNVSFDRQELIDIEEDMLGICLSFEFFIDDVKHFLNKENYFIPYLAINNNNFNNINIVGKISDIVKHKIKSGKNFGKSYYRIQVCDNFNKVSLSVFNDEDIRFVEENVKKSKFVIIYNISYNDKYNLWNLNNGLIKSIKIF